jgi:tetratricopeptide (TPR) repeat protein
MRAQCMQRLAQVLARQARQHAESPPWKDLGILDPPVTCSPEQMLAWSRPQKQPDDTQQAEKPASADPATAAPAADGTAAPVIDRIAAVVEILRRVGPQPEEVFVRVRLPEMPVAAALEQLVPRADLRLTWSEVARETVLRHKVGLCLQDASLAMALDGILDPLDLLWEAAAGELKITSHQEAAEETSSVFRTAVAERMLRLAITSLPEHELTDEACWALGSLQFDHGQYPAAAAQYEEYLKQFPQVRSQAGVHFNLAKTHLLLDRRDRALRHFYYVVDSAVAEDYVSAAYLFLGRLYLEDDCAPRAIKPLTHGLALTHEPSEEAIAALTLTQAYLLSGNPFSANRILMDHRAVLEKGPFYDHAAWLAALARYRAAQTAPLREKEGRSLIASMTHVKPAEFFGAQGYILLADAYRDLGLLGDMHRILSDGLQRPHPGAMRQRMLFGVAEYHRRSGQREKCQEALSQLAQETHGDWEWRAKLALADMAFHVNDDACLRYCYELLAAPLAAADRKQVLHLVGRVFERQGNYHGAALCFSGIPPEAPTPQPPAQEQGH